jgi:hypothetical protein
VYLAVGVLALGGVVAWTLLQLQIRRLERRLEESARKEAAAERRIREILGDSVGERAENGRNTGPERKRHVWLVSGAAALATAAAGLRHHPGPVLASVGSAAALMLLVIAGSSSDTRRADPAGPPAIVEPTPRSPSLTKALPSPGVSSTTPTRSDSTGSVTPTTGTTEGLLPPTSWTAPPLPTSRPTTTGPTTTNTTTVPPSAPDPCLLGVELDPLLDVCVG